MIFDDPVAPAFVFGMSAQNYKQFECKNCDVKWKDKEIKSDCWSCGKSVFIWRSG